MESKTNVLVVALVVAVLGASASALTVTTAESFSTRISIANMIDDLGGDSSTDSVLDIGTGGVITASGRVDHDGPFSLVLNGGDFIGLSDGAGYKLPDNGTGFDADVKIYDGTMDLQAIESFGIGRQGFIEIGANGTLVVGNNYLADFSGQTAAEKRWNVAWLLDFSVDGGQCISASDGLTLDVTDLGGGAVQVTAVPEPATLVLLGLGALVSRRRKRA